MRINHLFVGATDVEQSTRFYCDFFGFAPTKSFNDGGGNSQIVHKEVHGCDLDLLIVPIGKATLPYAHHIAFEADSFAEFETLLRIAKEMGLKPRSEVPLESEAGVSTFTMNDKTYRHFYVLDPARVNIEIIWRMPR